MWKTAEGSSGRLIQLCLGYFLFYVLYGVTVKYFLGPVSEGFPGMKDTEFLVYSTIGGTSICLFVVFAFGWYRFQSKNMVSVAGIRFSAEFLYLIPSGICTAIVIPTTTLMYMLPISVMVAMVIMRASVIIISRLVDSIQIKQGILKKKVYWEENVAIVFALLAASIHLIWARNVDFDFIHSWAAVAILGAYIISYAIRIYIMNYYRNTRSPGMKYDSKGFFAIEQMAASATILILASLIFLSPHLFGWRYEAVTIFRNAIIHPLPQASWAVLSGTAFGGAAFFSVFLFIFKGRTATFSGLVNRLTSLLAGTASTVIFWLAFAPDKIPKSRDWLSLVFILIAVVFLTLAEKKRNKEKVILREIHLTSKGKNQKVGDWLPQQT